MTFLRTYFVLSSFTKSFVIYLFRITRLLRIVRAMQEAVCKLESIRDKRGKRTKLILKVLRVQKTSRFTKKGYGPAAIAPHRGRQCTFRRFPEY